MNTKKNTPEKELIFTDEQSITQTTNAANNTLPYMQAVLTAYNEIPGILPIDTAGFLSIFNDREAFKSETTFAFYKKNYAEKHSELGINQDKGLDLVADKLPIFESFDLKLNDYKDIFNNSVSYKKYVGPEAFEVQDNVTVIVNENWLSNAIENCKLYLEYENEFAVRDAANQVMQSISQLMDLLPGHVLALKSPISTGNISHDINLNKLKEVFDISYKFGTQNLKFEIRKDFYAKVKAHARTIQ